jgi:flagellar hook assembly protein FlgD
MSYALERPGAVRVSILDPAGRRVAMIDEGWRAAGPHEARWDGRDAMGQPVANGVYFAVLEAAGRRVSRKIALVR